MDKYFTKVSVSTLIAMLLSSFLVGCEVGECKPLPPTPANLDCYYDEKLVASLSIEVKGDAAGGAEFLSGTWRIKNVDGLECDIEIETSNENEN